MIPAKTRKTQKDKLQRARRRRGGEWEKELAAQLDEYGWAKRWPTGYTGQPWDISALLDGVSYAISCKRIASGNLGYSSFRLNEIENLSRHEDAGGCSVVAICRDFPYTIRFVPWYAIRDSVLGGDRGSVRPEEWPEEISQVREVPHP